MNNESENYPMCKRRHPRGKMRLAPGFRDIQNIQGRREQYLKRNIHNSIFPRIADGLTIKRPIQT